MKVDTIQTQFGNIEVEYSTFTKGFFIKKFPENLKDINGLKIFESRENTFKEFAQLEKYVKDVVKDALVAFDFERKIILYKIDNMSSPHSDGLYFSYLVCDESKKTQKYLGKENELREYYVHDSNLTAYIGKRNILGQILHTGYDKYEIIDYDENIHQFFKDFTSRFQDLKASLLNFFDKEKVVFNILNSQSDLKLLM